MTQRFADFELDTDRYELRCKGAAVHVEPKVFDLIAFLAGTGGSLVTRDEIVEAVWEGRIVSDATISGCIKEARKVLGDAGQNPAFIQTVHGRGFRFCADIETDVACAANGKIARRSCEASSPSLAIVPLETIGDGTRGDSLARTLPGRIETILSRVPLLVIAADPAAANASYKIDGSVEEAGGKLRVHVQLSSNLNGFRIWAHDLEMDGDAPSTDELVREVVTRLEPQLIRAIFNDCSDGSGELGSRQLLLQALGVLALKGWHKSTFLQAADLLRQSITLEPELALAHAHRALLLALGHRVGILRDSDDVVKEALAEANEALDLEDMDSNVLGVAGCAICDTGQVERGLPILQHAIDINVHNGQAWAALGAAHLMQGKTTEAVRHLQHGVKISPADSRLSAWGAILAVAHLLDGQSSQAVAAAEAACRASDRTYLPRVAGSGAHLAMGDRNAAIAALRDALRIKPDLNDQEVTCLIGRRLGGDVLKLMDAARA